ncbi:MAG: DAK2 domain-containing protein [Lachnospiraceae bacterium]|nr:DAK2 domain-containing protein [Lachnospiraceae bacterium]
MGNKTIDAVTLSRCFLAGAKALEAKKAYINELNVFPVPDGDTGTNMTLTIMSAAREVLSLEEVKMDVLCKAMSSGSLRGARGNSGVILSQLIRGFTKVVKSQQEIDVVILSNAFQKATESAYKAVMKPKEGTILTVAKAAADRAAQLVKEEEDVEKFALAVIEAAEETLEKTPDMLPVLKQAGVVDSGGQGLLEFLKGIYDCLIGKEVDLTFEDESNEEEEESEPLIKYSYSVRFFVNVKDVFNNKNDDDFKTYLDSIGDREEYSVSSGRNSNLISVFIKTNDPGLAIQKGIDYGLVYDVEVNNLRPVERPEKIEGPASKKDSDSKAETFKEKTPVNEKKAAASEDKMDKSPDKKSGDEGQSLSDGKAKEEKSRKDPVASFIKEEAKKMGFISVTTGEGLEKIFKGLGVDRIISGGQTMNPSTEDMLEAIEEVNAENIFILPNNKNIIMAAEQAKYLVEDKNIIVIPTKTIPQGITALINYSMEASVEENTNSMTEEIGNVKTGQVTYAVRDTVISDIEIKQGNIMGIGDRDILAVGNNVEDTTLEMLDKMVDDESGLISIYYGAEVDEDVAAELLDTVEKKYPDLDVELHFGGQPIYYYVVSVE